MNGLIALAGGVFAMVGTLAAQDVTVVGTGDPNTDVPAVQAAVNQGGRVTLKGTFSFDAPPTVPEMPSLVLSASPAGMILLSNTVIVSGARDEQGAMTTIQGGTDPFYVNAPGAHVTIQGLHFVQPKALAIRVVAAAGLTITGNKIDGVLPVTNFPAAMLLSTAAGDNPPDSTGLGNSGNISGKLLIADNDIDMQGAAGANFLGIIVFAVGDSGANEADLYISGNNLTNSTERPINIYSVGGRAYIERNIITTSTIGVNVAPSGDVIHIVGPGAFLVAHNTIVCPWASGQQAGIRLQTRPGQTIANAIVADNDVNMSAPGGISFTATSAAIEVRGAGTGNLVLNNRIRGRANFALSVANQTGTPQGTAFVMNDLFGFQSAEADLFIDSGGTGTVAVGSFGMVEDHGAGTIVMPLSNGRRP